MNRRVALTVLVLIALGIGAGMQVMRASRDAANRQAFYALVQHVAQHGEPGEHVPQLLQFFGLPSEDTTFRGLIIPVAVTHNRTFTVRQRDGGYDVFLGDACPDREYHLLTNEAGELIRASVIQGAPQKLVGAEERFAHERSIWLEWWAKQGRE